MNIFLAVLGVHEFFHLGFPYTRNANEKNSRDFPIGLSLINFLPHASLQYHFPLHIA